jgi:hypothetical protein
LRFLIVASRLIPLPSNPLNKSPFVEQLSQHLQEHDGAPNFGFLIKNAGAGVYGLVAETTEEALT